MLKNRRFKLPSAGREGDRDAFADPAPWSEPAIAAPQKKRESDVIHGLRNGLILSLAIWASLISICLKLFG